MFLIEKLLKEIILCTTIEEKMFSRAQDLYDRLVQNIKDKDYRHRSYFRWLHDRYHNAMMFEVIELSNGTLEDYIDVSHSYIRRQLDLIRLLH